MIEYTDDEILDIVTRWDSTGLLYGLPMYEKQELAPIFDTVARISLGKFNNGEVPRDLSDLLDTIMYPVCRRLYRRVGPNFNIERMVNLLINSIKENKESLLSNDTLTTPNSPITVFSIQFADQYEDDVIVSNQLSDEEYEKHIDKMLNKIKEVLVNKNVVTYVDKSKEDWVVNVSDIQKSVSGTRVMNQKTALDIMSSIIKDINKNIK